MSKVNGYLEISPDIVIGACEAYLKDREGRQEKKKEEHIQYHMNKKWFPAKTREKALEMSNDGWGYSWMLGGSYWASAVRSIKRQAETAKTHSGTIFISDDVHDCIAKFISRNNP